MPTRMWSPLWRATRAAHLVPRCTGAILPSFRHVRCRTLVCAPPKAAGSTPSVTTAAATSASPSTSPPEPGKFRKFLNQYGRPGLVIYIGVYLSTLGGLYTAVENDLFSAGDAIGFLKRCGAERVLPEGMCDMLRALPWLPRTPH